MSFAGNLSSEAAEMGSEDREMPSIVSGQPSDATEMPSQPEPERSDRAPAGSVSRLEGSDRARQPPTPIRRSAEPVAEGSDRSNQSPEGKLLGFVGSPLPIEGSREW